MMRNKMKHVPVNRKAGTNRSNPKTALNLNEKSNENLNIHIGVHHGNYWNCDVICR
jgi:hypothetical protein